MRNSSSGEEEFEEAGFDAQDFAAGHIDVAGPSDAEVEVALDASSSSVIPTIETSGMV